MKRLGATNAGEIIAILSINEYNSLTVGSVRKISFEEWRDLVTPREISVDAIIDLTISVLQEWSPAAFLIDQVALNDLKHMRYADGLSLIETDQAMISIRGIPIEIVEYDKPVCGIKLLARKDD
jgi:hypothetical protein